MRHTTRSNNDFKDKQLMRRRTGRDDFDWTYDVTGVSTVTLVVTLFVAFIFAGGRANGCHYGLAKQCWQQTMQGVGLALTRKRTSGCFALLSLAWRTATTHGYASI